MQNSSMGWMNWSDRLLVHSGAGLYTFPIVSDGDEIHVLIPNSAE